MSAAAPDPKLVSRGQQRIGGVFIALVGIAGAVYQWRVAMETGSFLLFAVALPGFAVLGLALLAIPGYREERAARGEDTAALNGFALITPRWWIVLAAALAAGIANAFLLSA